MEKLNIILVIFFCGAVSPVVSTGDLEPLLFEDLVNSTVEGLRTSLPDPLVIAGPFNLAFSDDLINGTIDISDPAISGIQGFIIPYLHLEIIGLLLNFTLVIPDVEVNAAYTTDMILLGILPIYGDGTASIRVKGLQAQGRGTANTTNVIQVHDLRIVVELATIEINIGGLLYDQDFSSFASSLITSLGIDLIVPYLNDNTDAISDIISQPLEDFINQFIGDLLAGTTTVGTTAASIKSNNFSPEELSNEIPSV